MIKLHVVSNSSSGSPTVADFAQGFWVKFCCTHSYLYMSPSELYKKKGKSLFYITERKITTYRKCRGHLFRQSKQGVQLSRPQLEQGKSLFTNHLHTTSSSCKLYKLKGREYSLPILLSFGKGVWENDGGSSIIIHAYSIITLIYALIWT